MDVSDYKSVVETVQTLQADVHGALAALKSQIEGQQPNVAAGTKASTQREEEIESDKMMKEAESKNVPNQDKAAVKAQREAKKAAKAAKKQGQKNPGEPKNKGDSTEKSVTKQTNPEHVNIAQKNEKSRKNFQAAEGNKTTPETRSTSNEQISKGKSEKSKAELRAERRAIQEAQRAAKEVNKKEEKDKLKDVVNKEASECLKKENKIVDDTPREPERPVKSKIIEKSRIIQSLFQSIPNPKKACDSNYVDPLFIRLSDKFNHKLVQGSNCRCILLLRTIDVYISQVYTTPPGKVLKHDLPAQLKPNLEYLKYTARSKFTIAMENALESLNTMIYEIEDDQPDDEAKADIHEKIESYVEDKIKKAKISIAQYGQSNIQKFDKILVFSFTEALEAVLTEADSSDIPFEIILLGAKSCEKLDQTIFSTWLKNWKPRNIQITYIPLNCIGAVIGRVTKVFLGGHALFTNGGVMASVGSSTIALVAKQHNIPVVFFCETYKFCDKTPTDAFYVNDMIESEEMGYFQPRIKYDVTPADLVTSVITDIEILPSTVVPVVLRVQEHRPFR